MSGGELGEQGAHLVRGEDPVLVHQARLTVASHALDADDCRDLLEMLGLYGPKFRSHNTTVYGLRGRVVDHDEREAS